MTPVPRFRPEAVRFLRALRRHNRRDWFEAHRAQYERELKSPMVAVVEHLAEDFRRFAPELVASPLTSIYRIHRDIRFTEDKSPYKTHLAAVFPCRGLARHEGAGLYLEVAADRVMLAGGIYAPTSEQLQRVRDHLAGNFRRFRTLIEAPAFRREFGPIGGARLKRVPRGFPADHPAAEYLKHRQFLAGAVHPAELASSPRFYRTVVSTFERLAPLIRFLNEPLVRGTNNEQKG